MEITVSEDVLQATHLSQEELRQEIALLLFKENRLTLAQASRLAGMRRVEFQRLLASRRIPIHYDAKDLKEDIRNLEKLGRL